MSTEVQTSISPEIQRFRPRQFLMRYESAVNLVGGDDVALAKSFIIACEGPVLNWYSLLQPHSVQVGRS
jgi:hypothetical protein